jgi:hypothetical protein
MKRFLVLTFFICWLGGTCQKYYNDAQLWANLSITKKIGKKLAFHLENQDRFYMNMSEFRRNSLSAGVSYRFSKYVRIRADYRYITRKSLEGYYSQRNWYQLSLILKKDVKRFKFFYRNMLQVRMGATNSADAYTMHVYDRNKITIRHETTKRMTLWVAEEIYIPLNSPLTKGIERSRSYAGITLKTWKGQSVDLYFMYRAFLQDNNWFNQSPNTQKPLRRDYIYGLSYDIEF